MGVKFVLLLVAFGGLTACTQGHCRRQSVQPAEAKPLEAKDATQPSKPSVQDRVLVYKYDGSLQCGMGKPVSLETMAKELTGTQIYSQVKKPDGLMHIQVCGSPTGQANVFEIPAKAQKSAEGRGFKKWSFE